jgi:RHS repeat-associated protein
VSCIGRQSDLEPYLSNFGVPNYDPTTGRFLSIDPIWAAYPGMSPYAYCGNSPNVLVDPSGFGGHRVVHHTENGDWTTMEPDEEPMPTGAGYAPVRDSGMG